MDTLQKDNVGGGVGSERVGGEAEGDSHPAKPAVGARSRDAVGEGGIGLGARLK